MASLEEITKAMMAESRRLQELLDDHARIVQEESDAIELRDIAEATAYLASSGTVAEREAHVKKACHAERRAAHTAQGLRESNKLAINGAMQRLSAFQSLSSAVREEMRFARTEPAP